MAQEGPFGQAAAGRGQVLERLDLGQHGVIAEAAFDAQGPLADGVEGDRGIDALVDPVAQAEALLRPFAGGMR